MNNTHHTHNTHHTAMDQKTNEVVHVDFKKFLDMTQLQFNCLYRTVNEINKKTDHLSKAYLSLDTFDNTFIKTQEIDREMLRIHEECIEKFEKLKKS